MPLVEWVWKASLHGVLFISAVMLTESGSAQPREFKRFMRLLWGRIADTGNKPDCFSAVSCRSAFFLLTFLPSLKVFWNKWRSISNPSVLSTWIHVEVESSSCAVASCPAGLRSFSTLPGFRWGGGGMGGWGVWSPGALKCTLGAQPPLKAWQLAVWATVNQSSAFWKVLARDWTTSCHTEINEASMSLWLCSERWGGWREDRRGPHWQHLAVE